MQGRLFEDLIIVCVFKKQILHKSVLNLEQPSLSGGVFGKQMLRIGSA